MQPVNHSFRGAVRRVCHSCHDRGRPRHPRQTVWDAPAQTAQIIDNFVIEPVGSPLVRVSFTKGMIAADFLSEPTGTGLDMPSQTRVAD
jgi:hypothetical protein